MKRNAPLQVVMRTFSLLHRLLYQRSHGRFGAKVNGGEDALLLSTKGRKTGRTHTVPLTYYPDGEHFVLIAASAGADRDPDWYKNLVVHPDVTVQIGSLQQHMRAETVTDPDERERLWRLAVELEDSEKGYEWTQEKTSRLFPVVVLSNTENGSV